MRKNVIICLIFLFVLSSSSMLSSAEEFTEKTCYGGLPKTYAASSVKTNVKPLLRTKALLRTQSTETLLAERLVNGWTNLDEQIYIYDLKINTNDIVDLYFKIAYENPRLYYVAKHSFSWNKDNLDNVAYIMPTYTETDASTVQSTLGGIDEETENILFLINDNMSDFEKVMTVHDYIVLNYEYDLAEQVNDTSMMVTKCGMCEGYSSVFKLIMDKLGIECSYTSSDKMGHAWNLVKIDGEWYHIDVTWDDPTYNRFARADHQYALLSTNAISNLPKPHHDFDLGEISADSVIYDNAEWHNSNSAMVYLKGDMYFVDGTDLISLGGKTVYTGLDGGDGFWNIDTNKGYRGACYSGLSEYNGELYFATDTGISVYNPDSDEIRAEFNIPYTFGMYIHNNTLYHAKFAQYNVTDTTTGEVTSIVRFVEGGSVPLKNVRFGETYLKDENTVTKILVENNDSVNVFQSAKNQNGLVDFRKQQITQNGITTVSLPKNGCVTLYFWNDKFMPYRDKLIIE